MEKKITYKEAITELEKIMVQIEQDELDVDILSEKVKRAAELLKVCKEKLFKTDAEVQKILEEMGE
jgi:exodeoxyribonuclease VII small subunit